jgi:endonuclease YncB( thermonuclease family)
VTDGDTIRVRLGDGTEEPVRLIGIDAPESGDPGSARATAKLTTLLSTDSLLLVPDQSDRDIYGRLLRYVYVRDVFVNAAMVQAGFATAKEYLPDVRFADILEGAESTARANERGIWAPPPTTTTTTAPPPTTTSPPPNTTTTTAQPDSGCHPSYVGECVPVGVEDVDCEGGSGNGPYYVGTVQVVGYDEYDLDADGDGYGCE